MVSGGRLQNQRVDAVKKAVKDLVLGNLDFKQRHSSTVEATNRRYWIRGPSKQAVLKAGWSLVKADTASLSMEAVTRVLAFSSLVMPGPSHGTPVHGDMRGMRTVYLWLGATVPDAMVGSTNAAVIPMAGSDIEWWEQVERVLGNIGSAALNWDCIKEHRATVLAALQGIVQYAALKAHRQDCLNTVALRLSASAEEMSRSNLAHAPSLQLQEQHHAVLAHPHRKSAAQIIFTFMHVQVQTGIHA